MMHVMTSTMNVPIKQRKQLDADPRVPMGDQTPTGRTVTSLPLNSQTTAQCSAGGHSTHSSSYHL